MDGPVRGGAAGVRAYEGLPRHRKAFLLEYSRTQAGGGEERAATLRRLAQSTIARRVRSNESLDGSAVVAEVMLVVRARMSGKTREGLLRRTA